MSIGVACAIVGASAIVFGGLMRVTREIWRLAQDLRDNKKATVENTNAITDSTELSKKMDARIASLEEWRRKLIEKRRIFR
jgi:hypothetical protein